MPSNASDTLGEYFRSIVNTVAERSAQRIRESISDQYPPASEPETPPHQRTGDYLQTIQHVGAQRDGATITDAVLTESLIGLYLEGGTKNEDGSERMAPRPHFGPEAERLRDDALQMAAEAMHGGPVAAAVAA